MLSSPPLFAAWPQWLLHATSLLPRATWIPGIKALPSFYLYVNGVKVGQFVGAKKDLLREFLLEELAKAGK